jgi:hypothetical protein
VGQTFYRTFLSASGTVYRKSMRRKSISTLLGTLVAITVLVASMLILVAYVQSFKSNVSETFKALDIQNDRLKESLKFDFRTDRVIIKSAWNKDSLIRYVLTLDGSGNVIGYREVNFLVPSISTQTLVFSDYNIPSGGKYLFVTALGNAFDPLSSTDALTVYVYRVGTVHPVANVTVKIDGVPYVTDSEGVVGTLVVYGNRVVEIVSPGTGPGMQYTFISWSDGVTDNPRTVEVLEPTVLACFVKDQYYFKVQATPTLGGSVSPASGWYDGGSSITISATPAPSYRFDRWEGSGRGSYSGTSAQATITLDNAINETAYFVETASITFSASGLSSDASGTVLTVDGVSYSYSQLPKSFTWDVGTSHQFSWTSPVSAGSGKRYAWVSTLGLYTSQSGTIVVPSGGGSVSATYKTQYYLTMQVGGGSGSVSPSSGWYDAGASVQISATPSSNYRFDRWTGSGTGSYSGTSNPATVTMNGPISETAYFVEIATVTFSANGLSSDASGTVLTVDGVQYSYSQLPRSFTWDVGSSHSFSWSSPVSAGSGKQYVWVSTSGLSTARSGSITVPSGGGSVTASYKTQYYLTMQASPSGGGSVTPSSGWYDSGTQVQISASPASNYRFDHWTGSGTGSYSGTSNPATVTIGGPITETAYFVEIATVTFSANGIGSDATGTILTVDGVSYSYSQLPKSFVWDVGSSHSFSWSSPVSAGTGKQYVWTSTSGLSSVQSGSITVPSGGGSVTASYKTQYYLTVTSAYDSPTPSSGWYDAGSSITASVTSPVSGSSGTRYVCIGWTGTGSVPSSGSSTTVTFTINAPSSITWNWKTQYYLTMQASPTAGGSVSPSSGWFDSGVQVQISASPSSNYRFNGWTGSGTGSYTGSSNPATITMNGPISETANFIEIATVTFSASGVGSDASGTVLTVDGVSYSFSQLPKSFTWDVGTSHSFEWASTVSAGSGKQYAWVSTSGLSTSRSGSITVSSGGGSVSASYKTQYYLTMQVSPSGAGSTSPSSSWYDSGAQVQISATPASNYRFDHWTGSGTGSYSGSSNPATVTMNGPITETAYFVEVATITFSANGISSDASGAVLTVDSVDYSFSSLPKSFVWDVGSSHSFSWKSPVSAGTGKQYVWTSTSGLSTVQSGSITVPSGGGSIAATYKTQYYLTVSSAYDSPTPGSGWFDAGTSITASVSSPVSGGSGTQYVCTGWSGSGSVPSSGSSTSVTFTINAPSSITWNWKTQYYLTMQVGGGSGSVSPSSGWYDAGSSVQISATPSSSYRFDHWTGSGTGSYSGTSNPATVTMNSPITESAYFVEIATVTFSANGIGSDASGTVLTVDGTSYSISQLPKSFTWDVGSSHSFSWSSPVSAGTGKRYVWTSCSGLSTSQSGSITVPSGGGSVTASYKTQYYLTMQANPSGGGTVSPSSGWYDAGASVQISATPASNYRFTGWSGSGSGSYSGSSNPATVTMNGPITETANFAKVGTVTFSVNGMGSDASGTVLTVDGVSYSYSQLPKSFTWDVGSSHSFSWSSPVSGGSGKQYVWTSTSGLSTSQSGSITVPDGVGSVTATYKTQYYLTVSSAYDSPTPSSGWFDAGTSITASVSSPVSGGSGIQYVCTGWTGTGSVPSSGSSTSTTFTINAPSSITWNWKTQYYLTMNVNPSGAGTVSPGSGWRDAGSTVTISASANSGYQFAGWSGSGSGSYSGSSSSVTITMNGPITETANFNVGVTFSAYFKWHGSYYSAWGSGQVLYVDGSYYTASQLPITFYWSPGSSHSIQWYNVYYDESSYVSGTDAYYSWSYSTGIFTSQGGLLTAPSSPGSVTAYYSRQVWVTVTVYPSGAGSTSPSSSGWYTEGTSFSATAYDGYQFRYWLTGSGAQVTSNPYTVWDPNTIQATFYIHLYIFVWDSEYYDISGVAVSTPVGTVYTDSYGTAEVYLPYGSNTISLPSSVSAFGYTVGFWKWSDGSTSTSKTIYLTSPTSLVAYYKTSIYISNPNGGTWWDYLWATRHYTASGYTKSVHGSVKSNVKVYIVWSWSYDLNTITYAASTIVTSNSNGYFSADTTGYSGTQTYLIIDFSEYQVPDGYQLQRLRLVMIP